MELVFKNKRKITGENYKELSAIYLEQITQLISIHLSYKIKRNK